MPSFYIRKALFQTAANFASNSETGVTGWFILTHHKGVSSALQVARNSMVKTFLRPELLSDLITST